MSTDLHFQRSDSLAAFAAALAAAQAQMKPALKDSVNPFFKSRYADLSSVIEAIRVPLSTNGIAFMQFPVADGNGAGCTTLFVHSSGEWVAGTLILPVAKDDAQGIGSATAYAKRYSLQAVAGLPTEDDDGNSAVKSLSGTKNQPAKDGPPRAPIPAPPLVNPSATLLPNDGIELFNRIADFCKRESFPEEEMVQELDQWKAANKIDKDWARFPHNLIKTLMEEVKSWNGRRKEKLKADAEANVVKTKADADATAKRDKIMASIPW